MKKILLISVSVLCFFCSVAQLKNSSDNQWAFNLVKNNSKIIGLSGSDLDAMIITRAYTNSEGISLIYLQQGFQGLPVFNQMIVLAFRKDKLLSQSGSFIGNIALKANLQTATPSITPDEAVKSAIKEIKLPIPSTVVGINNFKNARQVNFGKLGIASENVTTELMWVPVKSEKMVKLAWQVLLVPIGSSDYWNIRIDAITNAFLEKNNLTVYDKWDKSFSIKNKDIQLKNSPSIGYSTLQSYTWGENLSSPSLVNTANYLVIPYPAESPSHPGGTAASRTNPWTLAGGNAASLGWHSNGTTNFTTSRGNNVHSHEDRANNNSNNGIMANSGTSPDPLNFNFPPDYTTAPTTSSFQQFAITNLFYWNNIMHDISYNYGFTETAGNFQANNQGRGGTGNDYVQADAQDGGGSNNANFSTPVDGSSGRMQMYLFNGVIPNRDGDLDNGIIAHEYGHGISTRLTGGPANSSCLSNAEQGGEGWSDYIALMVTTNWASAQVTDGALARPLGTYVLNQSPTSAGIRRYPYSTNMSINPWTYANLASTGGEVHDIGEIWCAALWEMTWEMIAIDGINTNLFNASGAGGNSAAFKLVIEGMRLQPCSPGYIDARNAILKADTIFFGAKYSCAIWKAFAKRGMGKNASQGSSNSTTDQVADFNSNGGLSLALTQNVIQQEEGLNITYTNRLNAGSCGSLTNYILTDTLPQNVTYVSGGTYTPGNRVVSFPVNLASGSSQNYSFTVKINQGSYFPAVTLLNEQLNGPSGTIPASWTATSTTTSVWTTHNLRSYSAPNSFFTPNRTTTSDQKLETTSAISLGSTPAVLSFWHWYNTEASWDGGVAEISTNGGTTWTDLGSRMVSGGYNGSLGSSPNPLSGKSAFTGNSGNFIKTSIDLTSFINQSVKFRFRMGSDGSVAATGWNIDDVLLQSTAVVKMRTGLFNNTTRIALSDTTTIILPSSCTPGSIITQPSAPAVCAGGNITLSIVAAGTGLSYQWQESSDGGTSFTNINGADTTILSLTSVATSINNHQFRCVINGTCTTNLVSEPVVTIVNALPLSPAGNSGSGCAPATVTISATPGNNETIDWFDNITGGNAIIMGSLSFTTQVLNNSRTFYASARNTVTGCISEARTAVNALIFNPTGSTTSVTVCSGQLPYIWNNSSFNTGGSYVYHLSNDAGCDSAATLLLDVIQPIVQYNVTGGGNYPAGGNGVSIGLSNSESGIVYQLILNGTTNAGAPVTGTGNSINFGNQTAEGNYTVIANPSGLCPQAMSGSADISIISAPPAQYAVTGGGTYCSGSQGLQIGLASSQTGVSYQLQRQTGTGNTNVGTAITGTGAMLNFGFQTVAGTYAVLATNTSTLLNQAMLNTVNIRIALAKTPSIPGAITGPTDACPLIGAGVAVYRIMQAVNATSYLWSVPSGASIVGSNTDTAIAVQYSNTFVSGNISVVAVNSCFGNAISSTRNLAITRKVPATPGTITASNANPCSIVGTSSTAGYTIRPVLYATSYLWTLSAGISLVSNAGDTGIIVKFETGFTSGTVKVSAVNYCSVSAQRSIAVTAKVPAVPLSLSGPSNVCSFIGQAFNATYSIPAVADATSYTWIAPANSTIISGQGSTSIQVSFAANFVSGILKVSSVAACGSSAAKTLSLVKTVAKPGTINASAPSCPSTTVTYSIAAVPFADSYQWSVPTNAIYVSGQGTTNFVISYKPTFVSGTVTVKSINACGTSAVNSLAVSSSGCPSAKPEFVSLQSFSEIADENEVSIFPNPNRGSFTVTVKPWIKDGFIGMQLLDSYGKIVYQQNASSVKNNIAFNVPSGKVSAGIYQLRYVLAGKAKILKVLIID